MSLELHTLADRCLAGDEEAAVLFVRRFQGPVFGLCWRMLRHHQDAEDVAQESLVRALKHLQRWDRTRPLEPWLLAIAANRCRTKLASRKALTKSIDQTEEPASNESREVQLEDCLREEVELLLASIRTEHARAFRLFHEEECGYEEIASNLNVPIGTAKTWVHRARQELARQLIRRDVVEKPLHALPTG